MRIPSKALPIVAALLCCAAATAYSQNAALVKDINAGAASSGSSPIVVMNNVLCFAADNGSSGKELWRSDGTTSGTWVVKDINPKGASDPTEITNCNGVLYMAACDGINGMELWSTDGTGQGTIRVTDINPGAGSSSVRFPVAMNGKLYFFADDGSAGFELWQYSPPAPGSIRTSSSGIRFVGNRGQIADSEGRLRPEIRFFCDAPGARLYFMPDKASCVFSRETGEDGDADSGQDNGYGDPMHGVEQVRRSEEYRLDMHFPGCNRAVKIRAFDELEGYYNYYLAHCPDGVLRVPGHGRIVCENLWDGIDMVFASAQGRVKYEFIVRPGGDPSRIRMLYEGAGKISTDLHGNLRVETPLGSILDEAPLSMQDGTVIGSAFLVSGNIPSVEVEAYDISRPLTIDPWATYFGGSVADGFSSAVVDGAGNYLVSGHTTSTNFPVHNGWQPGYGGGSLDMCVVKLTSS